MANVQIRDLGRARWLDVIVTNGFLTNRGPEPESPKAFARSECTIASQKCNAEVILAATRVDPSDLVQREGGVEGALIPDGRGTKSGRQCAMDTILNRALLSAGGKGYAIWCGTPNLHLPEAIAASGDVSAPATLESQFVAWAAVGFAMRGPLRRMTAGATFPNGNARSRTRSKSFC